jgi:multisubunit Na+/H+ antiporter MnhB subunit
MNATGTHRRYGFLYWAGVALGPAAWAVSTQTLYSLAAQACTKSFPGTAIIAAVLGVVAAAGSIISFCAVRRDAAAEWEDVQGGRARNFMAWLGVGAGVLFALVIANQLAAAVMISPCLR